LNTAVASAPSAVSASPVAPVLRRMVSIASSYWFPTSSAAAPTATSGAVIPAVMPTPTFVSFGPTLDSRPRLLARRFEILVQALERGAYGDIGSSEFRLFSHALAHPRLQLLKLTRPHRQLLRR